MAQSSSSQDGAHPLLSLFDVSEQGFAWRAPRPEQIRERRAAMDDKLLFDNLLISGGIRDPDFIYPPHDVAGLTRLLNAIDSSSYDALKKQTLIYFLLKWENDGGLKADQFKIDWCIPPQFSSLADAYWHLDTGVNVGRAVSILSDSRVKREYASKIIQAITLSDQPGALLRRYVRTSKPALVHPPDLVRYALALAESSLVEAWQYQRTFSEKDEVRPRLFKRLLDWVIHPVPKPKALKELISLPLSDFEENLLNEHAMKPPEEYSVATIARLQDLVCVRYIELGKYAEAIKMDRKFSSTAYDGKESSDRRSMIKELYDALPPVEKSLIDMPPPVEKPKPREPPANADVSMSQSWEEVRMPENLNKSTSTPLRNIQIPSASAARFSVATGNADRNPLSISAGPLSLAPVLPLPVTSISAAPAFTPRKSAVGQHPHKAPPHPLLGSAKSPLSGVGKRLAAGAAGISSPASGLYLPLQTTKAVAPKPPVDSIKAATAAAVPPAPPAGVPGPSSAHPVFKNTAHHANAFFQPKPKSSQIAPPAPGSSSVSAYKRTFDKVDQSPEQKGVSSARPLEGGERMAVDEAAPVQEKRARRALVEEDDEHEGDKTATTAHGGLSEDEAHALDRSLFAPEKNDSRGPSSRVSQARNVSSRKTVKEPEAQPESISAPPPVESVSARLRVRKQLPGAFQDDDAMDEDSAQEASEAESVAHAAPQTRRRASVKPRSASGQGKESNKVSKPTRAKASAARKSKGVRLGTTSGEEEDVVPPLPEPSSPKVTAPKRPIRKSRSIAASDGGDEEGGTRRRSSRLTTAGSSSNLSPDSSKGEGATVPKSVKKSRSSGTGRTKRK